MYVSYMVNFILFRCYDTTEAQGLEVLGGGEGSGHALTMNSKGT